MKTKLKKCRVKGCENTFTPYNSLHKWCSPEHGLILAKEAQEKARKAEVKAFNRETKARREKIKSRSEWLKDCQKVFNRYIRLRDKGQPCISCGEMPNYNSYIGGSGIHAGHYKTTAASPALRFHEDNCNVQCYRCNVLLSGNIESYRQNLKDKIGDKRLAFLEGPHEPLKLTIEEIKEIKATYTRKAKEIIDNS